MFQQFYNSDWFLNLYKQQLICQKFLVGSCVPVRRLVLEANLDVRTFTFLSKINFFLHKKLSKQGLKERFCFSVSTEKHIGSLSLVAYLGVEPFRANCFGLRLVKI